MRADGNQSQENVIYLAILFGIVLFVLIYVYQSYSGEVNTVLLLVAKSIALPVSYLYGLIGKLGDNVVSNFFYLQSIKYDLIGRIDAFNIGFNAVVFVYGEVGKLWLPFTTPLFLLAAWRVRKRTPETMFSRPDIDMNMLLRQNVKFCPILAPVVDRELDKEPQYEGRWRIAYTYIEWVVSNNLLRRHGRKCPPIPPVEHFRPRMQASPPEHPWSIDEDNLRTLLVAQLGQPIKWTKKRRQISIKERLKLFYLEWFTHSGKDQKTDDYILWPKGVPDHYIALAGVCFAFSSGKREEARNALGIMALSYKEDRNNKNNSSGDQIDLAPGIQLYQKYGHNKAVWSAVKNHRSFANVWMFSLMRHAQIKGSLPSSEYIWLKPYDRTLFYVLNQVGRGGDSGKSGSVAWIEGLGVVSHYNVEYVIQEPVLMPAVEPAIKSLVGHLSREGWITEDIYL